MCIVSWELREHLGSDPLCAPTPSPRQLRAPGHHLLSFEVTLTCSIDATLGSHSLPLVMVHSGSLKAEPVVAAGVAWWVISVPCKLGKLGSDPSSVTGTAQPGAG